MLFKSLLAAGALSLSAGAFAAPAMAQGLHAQPVKAKALSRLDKRLTLAERTGRIKQGSRADHIEDRIDRREDRVDARITYGPRDRIEDRLDRRENRRDRRR